MVKLFNVEQLGELSFYKVLVTIESLAVLFLCKNEKGKLYLFVERESNQEFEQWVAIETNEEKINKLYYKKGLTLDKIFYNKDIHYLITHFYDNDTYSCKVLKSYPDDMLSAEQIIYLFTEKENK